MEKRAGFRAVAIVCGALAACATGASDDEAPGAGSGEGTDGGASASSGAASGGGTSASGGASSGASSTTSSSSGASSSSSSSSGASSSSSSSGSSGATNDAGAKDAAPNETGSGNNKPACHSGPGWAAFRFHYAAGSTDAKVEAFGLPDNSNWEATPVFTTSVVDLGNGGGLEIGGNNYILIRYSVVGVSQITSARVSIFGRSYDTTASSGFEAWSPIYGPADTSQQAVSNAWPYAWTTVDYTGFVQPGDAPGLTGIELKAFGGAEDLVIHTVELCIEGT